MIQLSGAGKRYGHKLLFEDADWLITQESRIGLVGANGTGKSTVMKILAGSESLDYGSISRAKGISSGYLPQDGLTMTGRTIFAECLAVFDELHSMEKEMEALTRSMSELDHESQDYANVADRYQKLEHEFVARDGYTLEAQVGSLVSVSVATTGSGRPRNFPEDGRCASRSPNFCCKSQTCCCSTSQPTISISKPATGWRST